MPFGTYATLLKDPKLKHGYSGVGVLLRKAPTKITFGFFDNEPAEDEGRLITVHYSDCALIAAYFPAYDPKIEENAQIRRDFNRRYTAHCKLLHQTTQLLFAGDFNVARTRADVSTPAPPGNFSIGLLERQHFEELINDFNLQDLGADEHKVTWCWDMSKNIGLRVDYILIPKEFKVIYSKTHQLFCGSDHYPVSAYIYGPSCTKLPNKDPPIIEQSVISPLRSQADISPLAFSLAATTLSQADEEHILQTTMNIRKMVYNDTEDHDKTLKWIQLTQAATNDFSGHDCNQLMKGLLPTIPIRRHSSAPRVQVHLFGVSINALIDTGATLPLLSSVFLQEHQPEWKDTILKVQMQPFIIGDGSTMRVIGLMRKVKLQFTSSNSIVHTIFQDFYVLEGMAEPAVIGHGFFYDQATLGADVSYKTKSLIINGYSIPWVNESSTEIASTYQVMCSHTAAFPPRCTRAVQCYIQSSTSFDCLIGILDPDMDIAPLKIHCDKAYKTDSLGRLEILISNPTPFEFTLDSSKPLVNFELLAEEESSEVPIYNTAKVTAENLSIAKAKDNVNPLMTETLLKELNSVPVLPVDAEVPDFFTNGQLDDEKLPACLKGFRVNLEDLIVTQEQFNIFIQECCVLPPDRDKLFSPNKDPGLAKDFQADVRLSDTTPWQKQLKACHIADKLDIKKICDEYEKQHLIEPSRGCYAAQVILIRKKGGRDKIACNFDQLNLRTIKDCYPLPLITDNLDSLTKFNFLSSIDICGGYLSIEIAEKDRDYFGFITHHGLYRWVRVPYGWKNSGAQFNRLIDRILAGLKWSILMNYVDDILLFYGYTFREHLRGLNIVFNRIQNSGLRISLAKCHLFKKAIAYLGFLISNQGIQPDPANVTKILKVKLNTLKDVRSFIGLAQFYRRFIEHFTHKCRPLFALLKKGTPFKKLPDDAARNVEEIKHMLTQQPILRHHDPLRTFYLKTDASQQGLGASLGQKDDSKRMYAVSFASTALLPSDLKLCAHELELKAAVWGMTYYRHFLLGAPFILQTDNVVIQWLRRKRYPGILWKYVLESQEYDFKVEHVPGQQNQVADFLSRTSARCSCYDIETFKKQERGYMAYLNTPLGDLPLNVELPYKDEENRLQSMSEPSEPTSFTSRRYSVIPPFEPLEYKTVFKAQREDPAISKLIRIVTKDDELTPTEVKIRQFHQMQDGLLVYATSRYPSVFRIYIPSPLVKPILRITHGLTGHRGIKPVLKYLYTRVYWPKLRRDVIRWIRACRSCSRAKTIRPQRVGLTRLIIAIGPWKQLCIDWLGSELPTCDGYKHALVIICTFTRYPIVVPCKDRTSYSASEALLHNVFSIFGFPHSVHSDNEQNLISGAMALLHERFGIKRTSITYRHPQGNSIVERFMRYLNASFTVLLPRYTKWVQTLPLVLFSYRIMTHEVTGFSPFYLVFGRHPITPLDLGLQSDSDISDMPSYDKGSYQSYVDDTSNALRKAYQFVRRIQLQTARRRADDRDIERQEPQFQIGDPVLIYDPQVGSSTDCATREVHERIQDTPAKWRFKWSGPHIISKVNDNNTVQVYYQDQKRYITHNVSNVVKYNPFSDEIDDTAPPSAAQTPLSLQQEPSSIDIDDLRIGSVCAVHLPDDKDERIGIGTFQSFTDEGNLILQWHGNYLKEASTYEDIIRKTCWQPGWVDPKDTYWYFQQRRVHSRHTKLTNLVTNHRILPSHLMLRDIKLLKSCRLPRETSQQLIDMDIALRNG